MATKKKPQALPDPYRLQERYALAASEFDKISNAPRRVTALRRMARALQDMSSMPAAKLHFDVGAYRAEYENRLAKLTGVRVSAPPKAPAKKRAPTKKRTSARKDPSKPAARRASVAPKKAARKPVAKRVTRKAVGKKAARRRAA